MATSRHIDAAGGKITSSNTKKAFDLAAASIMVVIVIVTINS